ncbi:MAG: tRNA (adenosine(37)-N6)-threonylcarbamoyltransferase complex transferase subunit TsaD [Bacteroidia bacterium]
MQANTEAINILAIESSCDETSASVFASGKILSNIISTQAIHKQYGGVVPELASRAHLQNILPVVEIALQKAQIDLKDLSAIAYTQGPGLIGALMVGSSFAKSLAMALQIPLIGVHHMQAHILAHFIDEPKPQFPFLCLTVSGGHTQLVILHDYFEHEIIGKTIDDAAGEAFDKVAKILGIPYPGGPLLDKYAQTGNPDLFKFPVTNMPNYDFSFSGLKTSVLYFIQKQIKQNSDFINQNLNHICASVQQAIVTQLMQKVEMAVKNTGINQIALAGGVSANSSLRNNFIEFGKKHNVEVFIPAFEYCTDNAAMIAIAGYYKFLKHDFESITTAPFARG